MQPSLTVSNVTNCTQPLHIVWNHRKSSALNNILDNLFLRLQGHTHRCYRRAAIHNIGSKFVSWAINAKEEKCLSNANVACKQVINPPTTSSHHRLNSGVDGLGSLVRKVSSRWAITILIVWEVTWKRYGLNYIQMVQFLQTCHEQPRYIQLFQAVALFICMKYHDLLAIGLKILKIVRIRMEANTLKTTGISCLGVF